MFDPDPEASSAPSSVQYCACQPVHSKLVPAMYAE